MFRYILRRAAGLLPTLFVIITLSFLIIRVAPGGPLSREREMPAQVRANIEAKYNLDQPLFIQYLNYLGMVARFDLGPSYKYHDHDINYYIGQSLPVSMFLGVLSLGLALALGLGAGIFSALKQNTWVDYTSMGVAVIGISVPLFVIGPLFQLLFSTTLGWLPTAGWLSSRAGAATLVMPVITLALPYFAYIARLSRASILEVLRTDYVRTARAKGLSGPAVIFRHVLKGALLPVVSFLGPAFAGIITGSVVVERIFRVPGLASFFVQSAFNRDYTLIMGTVIVYSAILIVMNLLVDVAYALLDPRVSYK